MSDLTELAAAIGDLDAEAMSAAQTRQDQLTKPAGSLGVLEQISIRLAGIERRTLPEIGDKVVVVMAADHGIVEEGTSAFPSEVTAQMVYNFVRGGAAINVLARHQGVRVIVVDIGVKENIDCENVLVRKIRQGTANMAKGPAMSRDEAERAVMTGAEIAGEAIDAGASIIATGEMGIGNTSASSAIISVLGGLPIESVVGRGTGIDDDGLDNKVRVLNEAVRINRPDKEDAIDVLAKVGGLEIAGLAGVILGCAARRVPVVIDGFISAAAALVASKLAPKSVHYMIASHLSAEPGARHALAEIGLTPILHMDMRLGEGTGAVLAMNIIEASTKILKEMATFAEAGVAGVETVAETT
ncbi:MAG: nicotinate-nucleotide--dimethylbenzimidazole phosphoribosyltransferase [Actinomycetota bacterium]|nr:nicotinate-nucleotide--dimethylbenzimidazole phosphoribosyltransferase [Actinomycetota bacterium]